MINHLTCWVLMMSFWGFSGAAFAEGQFSKPEKKVIPSQGPSSKPNPRLRCLPERPLMDLFMLLSARALGPIRGPLSAGYDCNRDLPRNAATTSDDAREKPDLLFRLAECYHYEIIVHNAEARELNDKILEAKDQNDAQRATQLEAQLKDFKEREKHWMLDSLKQYLLIADGPKFQGYQNMDQVLALLSYLQINVGQEDQARLSSERLTKDYPQSSYILLLQLVHGEYFYDQRKFDTALKFYDRLLSVPDYPVFGYALYKKGWVYYNLHKFKQARRTFIDALNYSMQHPNERDFLRAEVAKNALVCTDAKLGTSPAN